MSQTTHDAYGVIPPDYSIWKGLWKGLRAILLVALLGVLDRMIDKPWVESWLMVFLPDVLVEYKDTAILVIVGGAVMLRNYVKQKAVLGLVVVLLALGMTGDGAVQAVSGCVRGAAAFAKETIVVSNASVGFTAATYAPTAGQAYSALVTVETDAIRFWVDGSTPTATEGHEITASDSFEVCGEPNIRGFRMIRKTTDATVRVSYFR